MWKDPIVEETRQLREAFAAQHGHDADSIFDAILKRKIAPEKSSPEQIDPDDALHRHGQII